MNKTATNKSKQKKRTIISLLLIGAILIGGAFAFLTAQDSKTNVFTIGNISIDLIENFDADGDGVAETYDAGRKTPPTRENIIPGVDIIKEPYVKNTSSNPCRLYMTVKVPTLTKAEAYVQNDGDAYTLNGQKQIEIKAYAIQDGYADKTDKTEIWNEYFSKNLSSNYGAEDTVGGKVQMFNIKGINSSVWEIVDNTKPVLAVDENGQYANIYTYVYKGADNSYLLAGNTPAPFLFTSVALNAEIGGLGTEISTANGSVIETKGVDENGVQRGFIYGLTGSMDEDMLKSAVAVENATIKVTKKSGRYYGTGSKVKVTSNITGNLIAEYDVVVFGDVNGDGLITITDTTVMKNHLLNGATLSDAQIKAAKIVSGDIPGSLTQEDMNMLEDIITKKVTLEIDQATGTCKPKA